MHARSAVKPERRQVHDPTLHPFPGEGGKIRLSVRELSPGGHADAAYVPYPDASAKPERMELSLGLPRTVEPADALRAYGLRLGL